jgi:hypothetical protein
MCWGDWPKELPPLQFNNGQTPYQGWNAISIQRWKVLNLDLPRNIQSWPSKIPPQERIGKGILLWYFPPSSGLPIVRR